MSALPAPNREALAGLVAVERVIFHNPDSGFCVLRVKVRGQRELVTKSHIVSRPPGSRTVSN